MLRYGATSSAEAARSKRGELKSAVFLLFFHSVFLNVLTACQAGPLGPDVVIGPIVCDADQAVLLGSNLPTSPDLTLDALEAVAFRVDVADGTLRQVYTAGSGLFADASLTDGDTIYAVRLIEPGKRSERGYLSRSNDFGESWGPVSAAPSDIIGVAFATAQVGYAWGYRRIYVTEDGGSTWSGAGLPGTVGRGRGAPQPVLDPAGDLWIAVSPGERWTEEENTVVRVTPQLEIEPIVTATAFRLSLITLSEGAIWLLGEDQDGGHTQIRRFSPEDEFEKATVSEFPASIPEYFAVHGRTVAVGVTDIEGRWPRGSWERLWPPELLGWDIRDVMMISDDAGASWRSVRLPARRIQAFCRFDADRIWMVSTSGSIYPPAR